MTIVATVILTWTLWFPIWQNNYQPPSISPKKGICIGADIPGDWTRTGATWGYAWGWYTPTMPIQVFGMIEKAQNVDDWMPDFIGSVYVMGFNEPELQNQGNVTPEAAAILWRAIENKYHDKLLVSPATVFMENWLDIFRERYFSAFGQYPRLDAVAVHCYRQTASDCTEWVRRFIAKARAWGIAEVWVTEFAFEDVGELQKFVVWMEAEPMITRYAYYISRDYGGDWPMPLFTRNGQMTQYGEAYRGN